MDEFSEKYLSARKKSNIVGKRMIRTYPSFTHTRSSSLLKKEKTNINWLLLIIQLKVKNAMCSPSFN